MVAECVETLIVGGGQAGLAMSYMLSRQGRSHVVLEKGRIAERWRSERWDGLRFQFPNWSVALPGAPFHHADPEGFATSTEIADFLCAYADRIKAPFCCGVEVTSLRKDDSGYVATTSSGSVKATNVVIATGPYQRPAFPALHLDDPDVFQVHANAYKRPDQLPPGAVLVVGSGASGAQISEELVRAGRRVFLSVGRHKRISRRYRGHDLIWWLGKMGLDRMPVERRGPDATLPLITGAYGGHTIDFRDFASQGITLLGRLQSVQDGVLHFADDLAQAVAQGDAAFEDFLDRVDRFVERKGMKLPLEPEARERRSDPPCLAEPLRRLEIRAAGISAVIWATGYRFDFGWVDLPVVGANGLPLHHRGIAPLSGIYFLGLPWLTGLNSSFLSGVGDDAARIADHIQRGAAYPSCREAPFERSS
jgi:putative flavoprotein involved in K+ transport